MNLSKHIYFIQHQEKLNKHVKATELTYPSFKYIIIRTASMKTKICSIYGSDKQQPNYTYHKTRREHPYSFLKIHFLQDITVTSCI